MGGNGGVHLNQCTLKAENQNQMVATGLGRGINFIYPLLITFLPKEDNTR